VADRELRERRRVIFKGARNSWLPISRARTAAHQLPSKPFSLLASPLLPVRYSVGLSKAGTHYDLSLARHNAPAGG
jgi:hypothetical protein